MILVKSNINKLLIIIIIIRKFSLSSASPETEMINLKIYAGWNKVNKVIMLHHCISSVWEFLM